MIPDDEVGCKICEKSIYRIFYEHVENCLGIIQFKQPAGCTELNPSKLQKLLECDMIEGIWIGDKYHKLGAGSRFALLVRGK